MDGERGTLAFPGTFRGDPSSHVDKTISPPWFFVKKRQINEALVFGLKLHV
jgi:hypothetical protein